MSNVVFDETRNHFRKNLDNRLSALQKALKELGRSSNSRLEFEEFHREDFLERFDEFYSDLIDKGIIIIIIVEPRNEILLILIERSIKGTKPFSPNKQEFRDADLIK